MNTPVLSEYRGLLGTIIFISLLILFSLTSKDEYFYRYKISKRMNIIFWNKAKNGTVPILSLAISIGLYTTVPILLVIKYFNPKSNLDTLTLYYLFIPLVLILTPSIMVMDGLASYKKKKRIKAEEEARIKMKRDNWIANNVKKKKKK
ncbi:hypothetical protein T472_0213855 [Youngiibacter fragilis 232.1]|uniref:Uncharacterized protein n=1 Tax=Youngiibacter fragilis 232.1 TaxID=994573 RepID=V7I4D4_9CLOT|nr:hypothetical protein T472_0213855 [Youngiibacter fragilis 232.1]